MSKKSRVYKLIHGLEFKNTTESGLSLTDVRDRIASFMKADPRASYNLMIGTDCQVHNGHTTFVTGIIIQRVGRESTVRGRLNFPELDPSEVFKSG